MPEIMVQSTCSSSPAGAADLRTPWGRLALPVASHLFTTVILLADRLLRFPVFVAFIFISLFNIPSTLLLKMCILTSFMFLLLSKFLLFSLFAGWSWPRVTCEGGHWRTSTDARHLSPPDVSPLTYTHPGAVLPVNSQEKHS